MTRALAYAKLNLALLVGERRPDGLHEIATVMQRIDLADVLELAAAGTLLVEGYARDTLVRDALTRLAGAAGTQPRWRVTIGKRIPVAAGLGGGSSDAAAALELANPTLREPLSRRRLLSLAAGVGSDVPFFLEPGAKLVEGAGERLTPLDLPRDYAAVVAVERGVAKTSTGDVYARFDELGRSGDFEERRAALVRALGRARAGRDLALLPGNDLAAVLPPSPLVSVLRAAGAFRADVTGAGPAVYGLFHRPYEAREAAAALGSRAEVWIATPVW